MFNLRNLILLGVFFLVTIGWFMLPRSEKSDVVLENEGIAAEDIVEDVNRDQRAQELYQQATSLMQDRRLLEAKDVFHSMLLEYPDFEKIEAIEEKLSQINMEVIFSNMPTDKAIFHEVVSGDTLGKLAKKYGTTIELIKISNNLSNDIIRIGQKLRIWTGSFNIFVDKSQNILIVRDGDEVIKVYNVSTGSNNSTPVGEFKVTSKLHNPVWFNKGIVVPPESPANVLGTRWLGFDIPGYGIHGTIEPETIGQQVTAGCVRMRNEDVEELYSFIPMRTKVKVVD